MVENKLIVEYLCQTPIFEYIQNIDRETDQCFFKLIESSFLSPLFNVEVGPYIILYDDHIE